MGSRAKIFAIIILVVVAASAVYLAILNPADKQDQVAGTASPAEPEVYLSTLADLEGNPVEMDQDKLVFMNVWATWCGPCNMEMPGIQKLYDKYKSHKKVAFYIISDEDPETVNPFIARKGYQLPFYQFKGPYPPALDGNAIPRTYIIYKGRILTQEIGASQWDRPEIIALIDKQLSEI